MSKRITVEKHSGAMDQPGAGEIAKAHNYLDPIVRPMRQESVVSLPVFILLASGTTLVALVAVGYCTWKYWQSKRFYHSTAEYTPSGYASPKRIVDSGSTLKISQSVPDLIDEHTAEVFQAEERIGRSHFKTVIKQSTLPNVPPRHQSFQRQLSNSLDFSNVEFSIHSVKYKEQPEVGRIKPELYRQKAQESSTLMVPSTGGGAGSTSFENLKTCGKLFFTLQYIHQADCLAITVIKAEDLPAKDFSGTSDPYVKIYLLPDRKNKHQTKVHRKTLNPEFNERFSFSIAYNDLRERLLQFSIYDFDRFSRHDLIGVVIVKDLGLNEDLSWEQPYVMDVICVQHEREDWGELMLSLCYLPTAGRLTVTILKARSLKAMDITGTSDPYVKVSLMCHGRRIKKKKTSVKKATLNPVYNEAIVFDVPQENIEEVSLLIKIIDYDRVGSNELMGCTAVGMQYIGTGRDHWLEMLENSRKPVAQWYSLQENVPGTSHDHTPNGKKESKVK